MSASKTSHRRKKAAVDDQPAVSLARLAEIGVGDGEGLVPRVAEAEGLSLLQEEALMDMIYQF